MGKNLFITMVNSVLMADDNNLQKDSMGVLIKMVDWVLNPL